MPPFSHASTSTVLESSPGQTKLSWPAMASFRWPQPELSMGTQLPSLDRFGVYKCWALKDKSPAAVLWKAISGPIITLLEDEYEHLDAKNSELRVEMVMIGRKAVNAVPTILFCSEAKITRQNAMALVKKNGVLACHPTVHVAETSRLPRRLALGDDSNLPLQPQGVYLNGAFEGCGVSVLVSRDGVSPLKRATIGGFVSIHIEHQLYGLTSAHAFHDTTRVDHISDQDPEFAFYDVDPLIDDSDEDDDPVITRSVSSSSTFSWDWDGSESSETIIPFDLDIQNEQENIRCPIALTEHLPEPIKLGSVFMSTSPEESLDWALVELENSAPIQAANLVFPSLPINRVQWNGRLIFPKSPRPGREGEVLICLGPNNTSEGVMSGVSSFSKVRGSKDFLELWQVNRQDGNFVDGNCGTWIIDSSTGDLLGQLVSGYHGTQIGYVVPADQIFRDIEKRLDSHVSVSSCTGRDFIMGNPVQGGDMSTARVQGDLTPRGMESHHTQVEGLHQWTALKKPNQHLSALGSRLLASSGKSSATSTASSVFSTESPASDLSLAYSNVSSASSNISLTNNAISRRKFIDMQPIPPPPLPLRASHRTHPLNLRPLKEERPRDMEERDPTAASGTTSFQSELSKLSLVANPQPFANQQHKTPSILGWNKDTPLFYHLVIDKQAQPYFALKSEYRGSAERRVNLDEGKYPSTLSAFPCRYPGCNLNRTLSFYSKTSLERHYKVVHGAIDEDELYKEMSKGAGEQ